jgi:hypothetical protein
VKTESGEVKKRRQLSIRQVAKTIRMTREREKGKGSRRTSSGTESDS